MAVWTISHPRVDLPPTMPGPHPLRCCSTEPPARRKNLFVSASRSPPLVLIDSPRLVLPSRKEMSSLERPRRFFRRGDQDEKIAYRSSSLALSFRNGPPDSCNVCSSSPPRNSYAQKASARFLSNETDTFLSSRVAAVSLRSCLACYHRNQLQAWGWVSGRYETGVHRDL